MNYVKLIAPAKVNLVLAVGDTRPDGFHRVDTIMHSLALHDVIEMYRYEPSESGLGLVVAINNEVDEGVGLEVAPEDNIIYQALMQFARALGRTEDEELQIVVKKHIPCEAGLGGGSSDAAAALVGAALLWGVDKTDERLMSVAKNLGSDVAFFLHGGCAYLQGRGDELVQELVPLKEFCVIVRPSTGVSTQQAYQEFDRNPLEVTDEYRACLARLKTAADVEFWNNMTKAARLINPEVDALFNYLEASSPTPAHVLCGSGSAVCIMVSSYDEALDWAVALEKQGYWTRVSSLARIGAQAIEAV